MIKGLIFDLNGTLIDILTDEGDDGAYRVVSNFLSYRNVRIAPEELKRTYFELNRSQRRNSPENYPEFDVTAIFREIITCNAVTPLPPEATASLALLSAEVYRAATRYKLQLYPGVREVLDYLKHRYLMAAVSDGQSAWAMPELRAVGLDGYFRSVIVSGDLGFRKPDRRMFDLALKALGLSSPEVLFVGNDMYRDVFGAHEADMKAVFFKSNQGEQEYRDTEADYIIYNFSQLPAAIRFLS